MPAPEFVPHSERFQPAASAAEAARAFHDVVRQRRSVRMFSERPVPREAIEWIVRAAASAPSGANRQPWRFVCVQDPEKKRAIRLGAEAEEREFYAHRASREWLAALEPLGTDEHKQFLEVAPWLIVVFKLVKGDDGGLNYYADESVGIACGFLLAAAQHAGLATLSHTPSPMKFLGQILDRPANEKPFLLVPVGYPADDCVVPRAGMARRPFEEVALFR